MAATKLSVQDRNDLALAIEIFGLPTLVGILDKNVETKKKSCESIRGILSEYEAEKSPFKPVKVLKASSQVAVRLIRDKMWAIFSHGVSLTNTLYSHFVFSHPVAKKEVGNSSLAIYKELLTRCCDANERVQEKAEDTLESMIINEKIRNAGDLHEALLQPLQVIF